jgi:hypothetical protein
VVAGVPPIPLVELATVAEIVYGGQIAEHCPVQLLTPV